MWLEDAKKATAHMARYGNSKESTWFFIDQINGDMFARREGYPKITRDEPLLGLPFFSEDFADYRVMKKSDNYICVTWHNHWEDRCLWVYLP